MPLTSPAFAEESLWNSLGRAAGLVSPAADPPEFVKATRPVKEPTEIPAFATPEEPRSRVKSAAELKAMDADLERAAHRHRAMAGEKPAKARRSP